MGESFEILVLGRPAVYVNGRAITDTLATKEQALLYFLAVTGEVHNRHTLAGLFWGDVTEQKAKTSLRVALSNLRKKCNDHLDITHLTVALDPDRERRLDAAEVVEAGEKLNQSKSDPPLPLLKTIAHLYRGDFLQDFFVEGTPAFEEWLLAQRSYYRQIALRSLVLLADRLMAERTYGEALEIVAQWLAIEPWDEAAHRHMMLALSRQGNFNAALAQYEKCVQILDDELGVEPMPETAALAERIQLARQTRPQPVPPEDTPLVGRQAELAKLQQMLLNPACRLVTITGLGGVGKTRLALATIRQTNQEQAVDFLNGVVFIPLASLASADTLPLTLADALDLQLSGQSEPIDDVLNFLVSREMLVILDNFEQLLDGVTVINKILQRCPAVKIVVTSREPLQISAEWRLSLEGLSHPPQDAVGIELTALESFEAVQLFVQAARQVRPQFHITDENAPLLQQLCCMVDGMPLALQLSAAWLRAMALADIIAEVDSGLDILKTSIRDIPERQRSMRVIFDQTWNLLNQGERELFPALSVFRGGFDSAAIAEVAGVKPWLLVGMVDRGLLQLAGQTERYTIHEMTRQYAAQKLADSGEESKVVKKHGQFYLGLIAQYGPAVQGFMGQQAIATLRSDIDNIRRAWRWALDVEAVAWLEKSMDALAAYYEVTGLFDEAIQRFGEAARWMSHSETADPSLFNDDPTRQKIICRLLVKEMEFAQLRGDYDRASETADKLLTTIEQEELSIFQADAHRELGILSRWAGNLGLAEDHLRKAVAMYEDLNAERPLATALDWLALSVSDYGKIEESLVYLKKAAELHARVNNERGLVFNKGQTAVVLVVAGKLQEALAYQLEVLEAYEKMGYPLYIARTANNIGLIYIELGNFEAAVSYMQQALHLQRQMGALLDIYNTLGNKGEADLNLGDYKEARRCFEEAQQYFQKVDAGLLESENLWRLATVYIHMGKYGKAQTLLERCLALTPKMMDVETNAFANSLLAQCYWRQGDMEKAAQLFDEAAVSYNEVRRPFGLAQYVHVPRALFLLEQGKVDTAVQIRGELLPWLENAGRNPAVFLSQLLWAKIAYASGNKNSAIKIVEQQLKNNGMRPPEKAASYYELWQMTGNLEHGRNAHNLYKQLADKTPNIEYIKRYQEIANLEA